MQFHSCKLSIFSRRPWCCCSRCAIHTHDTFSIVEKKLKWSKPDVPLGFVWFILSSFVFVPFYVYLALINHHFFYLKQSCLCRECHHADSGSPCCWWCSCFRLLHSKVGFPLKDISFDFDWKLLTVIINTPIEILHSLPVRGFEHFCFFFQNYFSHVWLTLRFVFYFVIWINCC